AAVNSPFPFTTTMTEVPLQIARIWLAFFALTGSAVAIGAITAAANATQATMSKRRCISPLQVDGGRFRAACYPTERRAEALKQFARSSGEARLLCRLRRLASAHSAGLPRKGH